MTQTSTVVVGLATLDPPYELERLDLLDAVADEGQLFIDGFH